MHTKTRLMATCLAAIAVLAVGSPVLAQQVVRPESVGMSSKNLSLIHDIMRVNIESGQIPGAIVLVARDGKIVHLEAQGFSDAVNKVPLKTDTIFNIASLTKPVTAVAILMLLDDGKLKLEDPVSKYIPELGGNRMVRVLKPGSAPPPFTPLPGVLPVTAEFGTAQYDLVPAQREITIRDLLTHTSGIQIFGVPNDQPAGATPNTPTDTLATRVPRIGRLPLEFQPGTRWAYSNGPAFEVLGRVVEVASGQPFNVFLKERVFNPLGMVDTDFGVKRANFGRALPLAMANARVTAAEETIYFNGGGGLNSTVVDYAKFAGMLANNGAAGGRQLLKPETVKMMSTNQVGPLNILGYPNMGLPAEGVKFGLGVMTLEKPIAAGTRLPQGSFGWDGVGSRRFWAVPSQKLALVIWAPPVGPAAAPLQRDVEAAVVNSLELAN